MTTPDARSGDSPGLHDEPSAEQQLAGPVLDDFGRPIEVGTASLRSHWLKLAIPSAITCGIVAAGLGVRHVATMGSRPYSFGYLGGVGTGMGVLADALSLAAITAMAPAKYSRTRTRWIYAALATAILLGLIGFLLLLVGGSGFSSD